MKRPIWIEIEDGNVFSGHQGHWADCFFANATEATIRDYAEENDWQIIITEFTDQELVDYPEAVEFQKWLMETYNEV